MRIQILQLIAFLGAAKTAVSADPVLHAEYTVDGTDKTIQLLVLGDTARLADSIRKGAISNRFTPTVHFERRVGNRTDIDLQGRDVCAYVTDCIGGAA